MTPPRDLNPPSWQDAWAPRWETLARAVGLVPSRPLVLALSGGADSVYLLHLLAASLAKPRVLAVHVDHMLRGEESCEDSAFCARLCARLSIPFARRRADLDPGTSNLEARARQARYKLLADEALSAGIHTILTGHHEDDALETLLLRWMRGSALPGLAGLKTQNILRSGGRAAPTLKVVRPLLNLRREEVRHLLRGASIEWREDSSNQSPAHTRNRVRNQLLPRIEQTCGPEGVDNLRAFASAVEGLEEELASRTANLGWAPRRTVDPRPDSNPEARTGSPGVAQEAGGVIGREDLAGLASPLQRRALWRLLSEATGRPPSRSLLAILQEDLVEQRVTQRTLPGGWCLHLGKESLVLTPPGVKV